MALTKTERLKLARYARAQLSLYVDSYKPGMTEHIQTELGQHVTDYRAKRLNNAENAVTALREEEGY